jgi:type I restriction enzyme R subunit
VAALMRAYAGIANELAEAGFTPEQIEIIKAEVAYYSKLRDEVKINSGDYIDLKVYEPSNSKFKNAISRRSLK